MPMPSGSCWTAGRATTDGVDAVATWNPAKGGAPSAEIAELGASQHFSSVLDAGCGWGRNLAVFAGGAEVLHGFDLDEEGVLATRRRLAGEEGRAEVRVWQEDLRTAEPERGYDLVICYGVTHFLTHRQRMDVYRRLRSWVRPSGTLAVASFNTATPIPPDLRPLMPEPPKDRHEFLDAFAGWEVVRARSHTYQDEHEGGIRHTHSIDRLMVRAPA